MKKFVLCLSLCGMLILTGCDKNQTLKCSKSEVENGMNAKQEIIAEFKNNEATLVKLSYTFEVSEDEKEYMDEFKKAMETQFKNSGEFEGAEIAVSSKDNAVIIDITMDKSKMTKEQFDKMELEGTYSDVKSLFEEEKFTCE